jgi:hypothetical protein
MALTTAARSMADLSAADAFLAFARSAMFGQ